VDATLATATPIVLPGPAIAVATGGSARLRAESAVDLATGAAVYIVPSGEPLRVEGNGEVFIATTHLDR
jgi:mannose-6-phosphate isomerase class I